MDNFGMIKTRTAPPSAYKGTWWVFDSCIYEHNTEQQVFKLPAG